MALSNDPVFTQGIVTKTVTCTAAKTTYNDATNAVRLVPAASVPNGGLVKRLYAIPRATATDTQLQVYRSYDTGVTLLFADSTLLAAYTMSQTTAAPKADFGFSGTFPMRLAPGEELWVATGVACTGGGIDFVAEVEVF